MSEKVYNALFALKEFNTKNIYYKSVTTQEKEYYKKGMNIIFNNYLNDITNNNKESIIYKIFLNDQSKE